MVKTVPCAQAQDDTDRDLYTFTNSAHLFCPFSFCTLNFDIRYDARFDSVFDKSLDKTHHLPIF